MNLSPSCYKQLRWFATVACLSTLCSCGEVVRIGTRIEQSETDAVVAEEAVVDARAVISPPEDAAEVSAPANISCDDDVEARPRWPFDESSDGWQASSDPSISLTWSEAAGARAAGALLLQSATQQSEDAFVFTLTDGQDLSGRLLTVHVLVEGDAGLSLKLFAQSGTGYSWADGGVVAVPPAQWVCLAFALDEPAFAVSGFDAASVRRVGVSIGGSEYRIYLDDISY